MDKEKIDAAVKDAVVMCGSGADRFVHLMEYMHFLKHERGWSDAELTNFHARLSRLLSYPEPKAGS